MKTLLDIVNNSQYVHFDPDLEVFFVWHGDKKVNIFSSYDFGKIGNINFERTPVIEEVQWSMEDWCRNVEVQNENHS